MTSGWVDFGQNGLSFSSRLWSNAHVRRKKDWVKGAAEEGNKMIRYEVERGQEWLGTFRGRGWDQEQKKNKRKEIKQTNKPARESKGCWTTIADSRRHNLHGSFQREAGVVWATNRAGYTRFLMTWLLGVCGVIPEAMVSYQGFGVWHTWMFPQHGDVFMWYILLFALWIFFFFILLTAVTFHLIVKWKLAHVLNVAI